MAKYNPKLMAPPLAFALNQVEKQFGAGYITRMGLENEIKTNSISTGSLGLDLTIGGGYSRGSIVEIYGAESTGKTTLALHAIANAQVNGGVAALIDAEHALDPSYAKKLGVDLNNLLVSQPDSGEQALEICELLIRSNAVDIIVIDSVAALVPYAELEGSMGEVHLGLQAKIMSQSLRKLMGFIHRSNTTVIFINQIRFNLKNNFDNPEVTPGGKALKFYASLRLAIKKISALKRGSIYIGNRVKVKIVKNKLAPPFKQVEFDIMFNYGICSLGEIVDWAVKSNVIVCSGLELLYNNVRLGQSRIEVMEYLKSNPDILKKIKLEVIICNKNI